MGGKFWKTVIWVYRQLLKDSFLHTEAVIQIPVRLIVRRQVHVIADVDVDVVGVVRFKNYGRQ